MDVFIQLFSSSAVLFLLVLGVISSSHAKEICSSARDGRCVLSSAGWTVVWSCAVHTFAPLFAQMEWGAFAQIAPQRASRTKEGRNFPGECYFSLHFQLRNVNSFDDGL